MWIQALQTSVPGDCSFVLEAVASGRLSLQAADVETTTAEVTMTICIRICRLVEPTAGDASDGFHLYL